MRCHITFATALFLVARLSVLADTAPLEGIAVRGECLRKVAQDRAAVTVASIELKQTAAEAAQSTVTAHEKLKQGIVALGLKDFVSETESYSVNEECSYVTSGKRCTGYRARLATRVETSDMSRIGEVIAVASKLGAQEVSQLQTFVSTEKMKETRDACLEVATQDAGRKAKRVSLGAGVALGKLLSVKEVVAGGVLDTPMVFSRQQKAAVMLEAQDSSQAPSIDSKPEEISVAVDAVYSVS
jgi:uncharacterized protein YggE